MANRMVRGGRVSSLALALVAVSTVGLLHCSSASSESEAQAESEGITTDGVVAKRHVSFLVASDLHFGFEPGVQVSGVNGDEEEPDDGDAADATSHKVSILQKNQELSLAMETAFTTTRAKNDLAAHDIDNGFRGVIVTGDVTDNGQPGQWDDFYHTFGTTYGLPVYETAGNHDYPWTMASKGPGEGDDVYDIKKIIGRNGTRAGVFMADADSGSYAWSWDDVVFINLGVKASNLDSTTVTRKGYTRYTDPFGSLSFMKKVLADTRHVGPKTPVILGFHYPLKTTDDRMNHAEREQLRSAIQDYHVVAILHGHRHRASLYKWCGVPVFEVDSPRNAAPGVDASFVAVGIDGTEMAAQTISYRYVAGGAPTINYDIVKGNTTAAEKATFCNGRNPAYTCWDYPKTDMGTIKVQSSSSCNVDEEESF